MIQLKELKIALVVQGRFHAFDLARELLRRGHEVTLFTNYPKWAVERFAVPPRNVRSLWIHAILARVSRKLYEWSGAQVPESWLHTSFGRWAACQIKGVDWDVVLSWSGVGEETFEVLKERSTLKICHRSSAHIRTQANLLKQEESRTGIRLECPGSWRVAREEREYQLADVIYVPSTFAEQTFIEEGVPGEKIRVIPHGVDTRSFRSSPEVIKNRSARILRGEPLRVLNVGTFSLRKGIWDIAKIVKSLASDNFRFRFVGPLSPDASAIAPQLRPFARFVSKQPQEKLGIHYEWGDIFILPTIEDGFPFVLAQASAAGLPILTTPHGAGTDLIHPGETGWVLPLRCPEAFIERLRWCNQHREELSRMAGRIYEEFKPRDWTHVAEDFEAVCLEFLKKEYARDLQGQSHAD